MSGFRRAAAVCLAAVLLALGMTAALAEGIVVDAAAHPVQEGGWYDTMEEVAVYLCDYGELPSNFITKQEARSLGWDAQSGNLWDVAEGCSIGGDRFGNYEGTLPDGNYHECDLNTRGADKRGAERLVYADDGRIYYTADHYESFEEITE